MLLTPTYHVFDLFMGHMDAKLIPMSFTTPDYTSGNDRIPAVNASASLDSNGKMHITLVNIDAGKDITLNVALKGKTYKKVNGRILTSKSFTDINTFENKNKVVPAAFNGAAIEKEVLRIKLPRLSVVSLSLE